MLVWDGLLKREAEGHVEKNISKETENSWHGILAKSSSGGTWPEPLAAEWRRYAGGAIRTEPSSKLSQ